MFVITVIKLHLFSCGTHFSIKGQSCSIREAKLKVDFVTEPNWLFRLDEHHVRAAGDHLQQTARLNRDLVCLIIVATPSMVSNDGAPRVRIGGFLHQ